MPEIAEVERGEVEEMPEIAEAEMPAKNCRNACQKLQNAEMPLVQQIQNSGEKQEIAREKQHKP